MGLKKDGILKNHKMSLGVLRSGPLACLTHFVRVINSYDGTKLLTPRQQDTQ
jgi:hypothetical protein